MRKQFLLGATSARAISALLRFENIVLPAAVGLGTLLAAPALANPSGGTIADGAATISQSANKVQINQSSNSAIINWQVFSIGANESVTFNQPNASSVTLNRVTGGNISEIYGSLQSNGRLLLINPKGIIFGKGSKVDVGGLIATTADISDENFKAGKLLFDRPGDANASVVNEGTITVADAGIAAFVAPSVRNSGIINANLGTVSLAAGTKFCARPLRRQPR